MGLPKQLQEDFLTDFKREPLMVARATCDLSGGTGLTWLACDGTTLVCYSHPSGGEFSRTDFCIAEASTLKITERDSRVIFQARFPEGEFELRLPADEIVSLTKLSVLHPSSESLENVPAPAVLTPNLVCGAAIYAMAQADGDQANAELDWVVARFGSLNTFRRGGAWVTRHGFAALLTEANAMLSLVQKEGLLFNLVDLGLADNAFSRIERARAEECRLAFGISEERYGGAFEALVARATLNVMVDETPSGPDWLPMNVLCACLLSVIRHRPEIYARRVKNLERRIDATDAINSGQTYLDQLEADGLLAMLPHMLNPAQRRCLVLNVLGEAYFQGAPVPEAGVFVQKLRETLGLPATEFEADVEIFRTLTERSLFRETVAASA
ncbi:MAG: hypothetical protein EBS05_02550 [Proteobacteria bacterium]|nr:hypothetical protein [Pseudomonadota bacterium]